ncbi:MAG: MFS transporter [Pseudomonadota bacterium]
MASEALGAVSAKDGGGMILERSRPLRFFTLFILYVGQGMPIGLFWFAIPAWMAVNGASLQQIGTVGFFTTLPWSLKLVNGFFMDRYTFLAMGRRRIWILGSQLIMIAGLLTAVALNPDATNVLILSAIGFSVNVATTFQDVAVDGLAVDIMTEDERARGSGMMFGGQAIGIAVATALTGRVIGDYGAQAAYLSVAAIIFVLCVYIASFRERVGERRLPWSNGEAHQRNLDVQLDAWWPLLKSTFVSLKTRTSILWVILLFNGGIMYGTLTGGGAVLGADYVGWDEAQITGQTAIAGLVAGALCITLGGWLGDKFGAKPIGILWISLSIALMIAMVMLSPLWSSPILFVIFLYGWLALNNLRTVALLPISMRLCDTKVAATQFTIYMAINNFGISFGGYLLSQADKLGGFSSIFVASGLGQLVGLILLLTVKFPRRPEFYAKQTEAAMVFDSAGPLPEAAPARPSSAKS